MSEAQQDQQQTGDQSGAFDIPAGQYKARGIPGSVQLGTSKSGTEEMSIDLVLCDLGRTATTILNFSDAAAPYSLDRLKLLGVPEGELDEAIVNAHCGKNEVPVLVKYEEYNGEMKMKVDIISTRFSFKQPMGDAEKRGFFARLKQIAAQRSGGSAAAAAPGAPTQPAAAAYPQNWDEPQGQRPALKIG